MESLSQVGANLDEVLQDVTRMGQRWIVERPGTSSEPPLGFSAFLEAEDEPAAGGAHQLAAGGANQPATGGAAPASGSAEGDRLRVALQNYASVAKEALHHLPHNEVIMALRYL